VTEVQIGQLTSRVETSAGPSGDEVFVARVVAEVLRQLQEASERAAARHLGDTNLFDDAGQED
jgi:hypothetical protein